MQICARVAVVEIGCMKYMRTQGYLSKLTAISHAERPQCNPGHVYLCVCSARLSLIVGVPGLRHRQHGQQTVLVNKPRLDKAGG